MRLRPLFAGMVLAVGVLASTLPAAAQGGALVNVYSVNFVCGYQASADGSQGYEPLVKVANYATKVDINNINNVQVLVAGMVHNTTASPWPNNVVGNPLAPNNMAMRTSTVIDCNTIAAAIGPIPPGKPFFSGMVTIRSGDPLVVWATKTTQVCAGTAAYVTDPLPQPIYPYQPIFLGEDLSSGLRFTLYPPSYGPMPPTTVDWSTFGCPSAKVDAQGGVYFGPSGAVPPGLRTPTDLVPVGPIYRPPTPTYPEGEMTPGTLSLSHSMDFERVEPEVIELPPGVQPPGCV